MRLGWIFAHEAGLAVQARFSTIPLSARVSRCVSSSHFASTAPPAHYHRLLAMIMIMVMVVMMMTMLMTMLMLMTMMMMMMINDHDHRPQLSNCSLCRAGWMCCSVVQPFVWLMWCADTCSAPWTGDRVGRSRHDAGGCQGPGGHVWLGAMLLTRFFFRNAVTISIQNSIATPWAVAASRCSCSMSPPSVAPSFSLRFTNMALPDQVQP